MIKKITFLKLVKNHIEKREFNLQINQILKYKTEKI
jgi:hypothetical protein